MITLCSVRTFLDYSGTDDMTVFSPRTGSVDRDLVIYAHGFLGSGLGAYLRDTSDTADDLKALATVGLVVAAPDLDGPTTWGRDPAWQKVDPTITYLGANLGTKTNRIHLIGDSMGALNVLNYAWRFPAKVGRIALRAPVVNLAAFRTRNVGVFGTAIEDAYGSLAAYNAALPTHDPSAAANLAAIRANFGKRIRIWGARSDDLIPMSELLDFGAATGARITNVPGEHGDAADQSVGELVAWLAGGA